MPRQGNQIGSTLSTSIRIRRASPADAKQIAEIHIAAWRAAYIGVITDAYLAGLDASTRTQSWTSTLEALHEGHHCFVAELAGEVAGFVHGGHSRDSDASTDVGEIYAIYVHPEHQGRGLGHLLLNAAELELKNSAHLQATLWVLARNPAARSFYEHHGWRHERVEKLLSWDQSDVPVTRYRKKPLSPD